MNTLHKLIERALANEWGMFGHANQSHLEWKVRGAVDGGTVLVVKFDRDMTRFVEVYQLEQIIFDIDFAKAVAGTERVCRECRVLIARMRCGERPRTCAHQSKWDRGQVVLAYEYFLTNAVLSTERLEYLQRWMEAE